MSETADAADATALEVLKVRIFLKAVVIFKSHLYSCPRTAPLTKLRATP